MDNNKILNNENESHREHNVQDQSVSKGEKQSTSTGLDENIAGLLSYLFGFITGIVFLLIEKENRFVRFHALQSIFISVALIIISSVLNVLPVIGFFISLLISPIGLILWILLMFQAYQGKYFKLPVLGDLAEKQLK